MLDETSPDTDKLISLVRHLRDENSDFWAIYKRIGFREYLSIEELNYIHEALPEIASKVFGDRITGGHQDIFISLGILSRLAEGVLTEDDIDGSWVANFIRDRRKIAPSVQNGVKVAGGWRPIELGWVMALAREVDSDPMYWNYFISLSEEEHSDRTKRPYPDPIYWLKVCFRDKHCLMNRDTTLGIFPLLYAKKSARIDDITDINQVKYELRQQHRSTPSVLGGFELDEYFEDLNR